MKLESIVKKAPWYPEGTDVTNDRLHEAHAVVPVGTGTVISGAEVVGTTGGRVAPLGRAE